jgi:hypothetical protein
VIPIVRFVGDFTPVLPASISLQVVLLYVVLVV